jgi:DNA polymerase III epsilon subunit-like protein
MIIIDTETTGLVPGKADMVSLGAVHFGTGTEFYMEAKVYPETDINQISLGINGFTLEQITDEKKPFPHEVYFHFRRWAEQFSSMDCILAGQQVGSFDAMFLKHYHDKYFSEFPWLFGYRTIDLHSIAFAKFKKSFNLDSILLNVGLSPEPKPHNALTGAKLETQAFHILLA